MTEAKPKDYWISPTALRITLNALSDADYIQATAASGAMVLCYMKGIDGLGYDNGHNYKRWPLKISQTYFTTTSKKYVYIRIPRAGNNETDTAMVVFPSQHLDLYGMTEGGQQVGDAGYYYIFTQGIISASEPTSNGLRRHWEQNLNTGTLDSDEALDSGGTGEWWTYNPITDMVTFLKKIAHGEFEELLADYLEAEQTVTDLVVSRNFLSGPNGEGFRLIRNAGNDVSELEVDRATIREKIYGNWLQSSDYTGEGMLDSGFRLWYENGRSKLVIDDIVARGKFSVYNLETRIMTHAGGDVCFSGAGSKLFYVEYLNDAGESLGYTTINSPWMLRDKFLLAGASGLAAWANRRKIQRQLTQEEKASVTKFRCYVFSDDGTMKTRNWWHVHDLARCQTFDWTQLKQTSEGYYSGDNVSNTVYWRRVAGIGSKPIEALGDNKIYDYFDLWNVADVSQRTWFDPSVGEHGAEVLIGADMQIPDPEHEGEMIDYTTPGFDQNGWDDWPAAGDDVVQFGNARDVDRMAVNVLQVTGGEPGLKVYHGIHTYRTDKCKWVDIGYDASIQRANAQIFGDCYIGERYTNDPSDGGSYVWFTTKDANGQPRLRIKARISAQSTYGDSGKSLYDYVREDIWSPDEIETMIGTDVAEVQKQLDGQFAIHYQSYTPYPQSPADTPNEPAASWIRDGEEAEHLYDLFYDRRTDKGWRWSKYWLNNFVAYRWTPVGDSSILASLKAAADAQDTADGKRRVFISQPQSSHEYDPGDLWVNATYGTTYSNDLLRCKTHKDAGDGFSINHWEKASKYTDDSAFNYWVANGYAQALTGLNDNISGAYTAANNAQTTANNAATAAGNAATAAGNAQAAANALNPIKNALNGATLVDGGLLLTSLIGLRQYNGSGDKGDVNNYTTWGGINGTYVNGDTIAAWFGGGMVDHELTPTASNYAKILFRMNGSGYMAGGKFSWDKDGNATIGGFEIGTDQLGAIDYDFEEGWAFIKRDGFFSVNKLNSARTYSAEIYGGAAIYAGVGVAGTDNDNYIKVSSNGVYIHGNVYINTGSTLKAYYHSDELGTGGGGGSTSVAWSDITGKPSTFTPSSHNHDDRYKISNGTITLGSNSITPITSHQSLSGYAQTSWVSNNFLASDALSGYCQSSWVESNFFSGNGGRVWGNIHLQSANTNYGNYIVFGDRGSSQDYAYIQENTDDHLLIYGYKGVTVLSGGSNGASGRTLIESYSEGWYNGLELAVKDAILKISSAGTSNGIVEIGTARGVSMYSSNENTVITLQDWTNQGNGHWISITTKGGNISLNPSSGSTEIYNFVNRSDIRNKNIFELKEYSIELFARSPLFSFTWKEGSDRREHIGTSAQYWQPFIPETVSNIIDYSKDGKTIIGEHLSLDYITLSYIGVVSLAREVMRLREEVAELRNIINN